MARYMLHADAFLWPCTSVCTRNHVLFSVQAVPPSLHAPPPCPRHAVQDFSVESFNASVHISVYRRPYPLASLASSTLLFEDRFEGAALEFGGAYVCRDAARMGAAAAEVQRMEAAAAQAEAAAVHEAESGPGMLLGQAQA